MTCLPIGPDALLLQAYLDERQIPQPPKLHGEAPPSKDLILIVWVLLEVVDFIYRSKEISQKNNVELVPYKCLHSSTLTEQAANSSANFTSQKFL